MAQPEQPGEDARPGSYPFPFAGPNTAPQHLLWFSLAESAQAFRLWRQLAEIYTYRLLTNRYALDIGGKALESVLQLRQLVDLSAEAALASMQMPTRRDHDLMMQKLSTLEHLVRDLSDKVDQLTEDSGQ